VPCKLDFLRAGCEGKSELGADEREMRPMWAVMGGCDVAFRNRRRRRRWSRWVRHARTHARPRVGGKAGHEREGERVVEGGGRGGDGFGEGGGGPQRFPLVLCARSQG
jgi:hypothetical protein